MRRIFLTLSCICFAATSIFGQVGIGTENPDESAILDITSNKMGVMLPRVALKSSTDKQTIKDPATGLLVYNLGTESTFQVEGFLFWNGSEWRRFSDGNTISPEVDNILCTSAQLIPSTYKAGEVYKGVLEVPYTGGNGGSYGAGTTIAASAATNNLSITLQAGTLEYGNGKLTFAVEGTPAYSSPQTTNLPVNFLTHNCTAEVGRASARTETQTFLGPMYPVTSSDGVEGVEFVAHTLDGRYSLRLYCRKYQNNSTTRLENLSQTDIQIRHNIVGKEDESDPIIILHQYSFQEDLDGRETPLWNSGGRSVSAVSQNDFKVYGKNVTDRSAPETGYDNLAGKPGGSEDNLGLTLATVGDPNHGWHNHTIDGWRKHGDPAVYATSRPEYRVLTFTPGDPDVKRVYRFTFFFGIPDITTGADWSNYASTKCWIYAEEIISE